MPFTLCCYYYLPAPLPPSYPFLGVLLTFRYNISTRGNCTSLHATRYNFNYHIYIFIAQTPVNKQYYRLDLPIMSAYDYDAPPRRSYREETRLRPDPRYEPQDAYYRPKPSRHELVPRPREDSDLSIEEVRRDFPPPGYRDVRRARSAEPGYDDYYGPGRDVRTRGKPGSVYYEEEERTRKRVLTKQQKIMAAVVGGVIAAGAKEAWDRKEAKDEGVSRIDRNPLASAALAAGGAFAGYSGAEYYSKHNEKEDKKSTYIVHKGRDGRVSEYYSDDEEDPRGRKGNKSFLENALSAAGLGGAIKALTGGSTDDRRSEGRSRRGSVDSRSSRRSRSEDTPANRMQKAAKASLVAGAAEAFRVSKEPGGWKGEKMKRVLTAAAGAATIDAAQDPTKDSKRHMLEAVVGGLVGNRVINGSRRDIEEDRHTGRSRSRSRSAGDSSGKTGLAALATAGLGALGAKKIMDNKDRSRSRSRSRRRSYDSYGSRSPSPRRRSRSRSVVDTARRSLAKIGLGSGPDERKDEERSSSRRSRGHDDRYDDDRSARGGYMRGGRGDDDRDSRRRSRSRGGKSGRSGSVSSSDLGCSEDDEKEAKKMKGKQILKAGLATVATIHAANEVYGSVHARNARHKAVKKGDLDPMEAKKLKSKAIFQDTASVGIALMSIKGVIEEMKEAREKTHQVKEWQTEKQRRHERRLEHLKRAKENHNPRSRTDDWTSSAPPRGDRYDEGPRYTDGNPYSASIPAPPVGYDRR